MEDKNVFREISKREILPFCLVLCDCRGLVMSVFDLQQGHREKVNTLAYKS